MQLFAIQYHTREFTQRPLFLKKKNTALSQLPQSLAIQIS